MCVVIAVLCELENAHSPMPPQVLAGGIGRGVGSVVQSAQQPQSYRAPMGIGRNNETPDSHGITHYSPFSGLCLCKGEAKIGLD